MSQAQPSFQVCLLLCAQDLDQRSLATELRRLIVAGMAQHPGFLRAEIQLCDDQHHVLEQFWWQRREDYLAYRQSADGQHAALWLAPYQPQVFHLSPFIQIEGSV